MTNGQFDPYHKWLGIPPEEQPADHYRLLGIRRFETDEDAIANAADQRMLLVRSFQMGRHAALSQAILNEIAQARLCLLNAESREAYDEALRREHPGPVAIPGAAPVATPAQTPQQLPAPGNPPGNIPFAQPVNVPASSFEPETPPVVDSPGVSSRQAGPPQTGASARDSQLASALEGIGKKPKPARKQKRHAANRHSARARGKPSVPLWFWLLAGCLVAAIVSVGVTVLLLPPPNSEEVAPESFTGGGGSDGRSISRLILNWPVDLRSQARVTIDGAPYDIERDAENERDPEQIDAARVEYALAAGPHTVRIEWPGYLRFEETVRLADRDNIQLDVVRREFEAVDPPPAKAIDLLARADPLLHARRGAWTRDSEKALISNAGQLDLIDIRLILPDEYDVVGTVERRGGDAALALGLVASGRKFAVLLGSNDEQGGAVAIEALRDGEARVVPSGPTRTEHADEGKVPRAT